WFDDGNLVLSAQGTTFRVHASLLSRQSAVLQQLCADALTSAERKISGCPVLFLQESSHDVAVLLSILYDGHSLQLENEIYSSFSSVVALARISHNYQIHSIGREAFKRSESGLLTQIDLWRNPGWEKCSFPSFEPGDTIAIVHLARAAAKLPLLVTALYCCTMMDHTILLSGTTRADGTSEKLSDADIRRCLDCRRKLASVNAVSRSWLFDESPGCSTLCSKPKSCRQELRRLGRKALQAGKISAYGRGVFADLLTGFPVYLCKACRKMIEEKDVERRRGVWAELADLMEVIDPEQ
ncbi:hypothetical protein POSPLADRAFT_1078783, partial [Postia placenta MAD-698-R-SB12]